MRCKKHLSDLSSSIGVCASCLRERLLFLIEAQAEAQARAVVQLQSLPQPDDRRNPNPRQLVFPRSVSPYISRRKSDTSSGAVVDHSPSHHRLFFSTPQLGPVSSSSNNKGDEKKKRSKFQVISDLLRFRSRSRRSSQQNPIPDPGTGPSTRVSSQPPPPSDASSSSWISGLVDPGAGSGGGGRTSRKNPKTMLRLFSYDEDAALRRERQRCARRDRGMSPDAEEEEEEEGDYLAESPPGGGFWRTLTSTTNRASQGRFRASPARSSLGNVVNGLGLCLSPLVRASPISRPWNGGGPLTSGQEVGYSGEMMRSTMKPHLSTNRSRKIADFGRFNHNR